MTKRHLPPYVYMRGGHPYFERRGWKSQRIHAPPGTTEFAAEYARILLGHQPAPRSHTFTALVTSYKASDRFKRLAPRTQTDYGKVLDWTLDKLGPHDVRQLARPDVIRARDANPGRFGNYIVQVMSVILEHAIDLGWIRENPARGVSLRKTGARDRRPWPPAMIKAFRAKATGRALLIFELALGTGQRIGDVLRMRWDAIDGDGITVVQGKTGARLWVPFTAQLRATLRQTPKVGLTICAQANGRPTSYRGAAQMIMAIRTQIGAQAYDIHALRHTAATELAALGCDDALIQAVTGHTSSAMVKLYTGETRQRARAKLAQAARERNKDET